MNDNYTITDFENGYTLNIDINIEEPAWQAELKSLNDLITKTSKHVFEKLGLTKYAKDIEFSITLTNNSSIQKLNSQYRAKNQHTNSLSFPAQEIIAGKLNEFKFHDEFAILGDIIFAYEQIIDEAKEQDKSFNNHFIHLLIHSILHLLGYDHQVEKEAIEMEALEVELLSFLDIKSPYETF